MKKEDKIKLTNNIFKFIFISLVIIFATLYISQATGYYEYEQHKKVTLTEEKIKQFEEDVAKGKKIDIETYLENTNKDYQTKTSKLGLNISENIGSFVRSGIEALFKFLNDMIE